MSRTFGGILTSSDGVTWTVQRSGTGDYLNGVTWTGSLLVAVGSKGAIITSPDGLTWTSRTPGNGNELMSRRPRVERPGRIG